MLTGYCIGKKKSTNKANAKRKSYVVGGYTIINGCVAPIIALKDYDRDKSDPR